MAVTTSTPVATTTPAYNPVPMVPIHEVALDTLVIELTRQREVEKRWVAKMVNNFNPALWQPIIVAANADGTYEVMDGQQRTEVAKELGFTHLSALVHTGLSDKDRARLFVAFNTERKKVSTLDSYLVGAKYGVEPYASIDKVVRGQGLRVAASPSRNQIAAVSGLIKVHKEGGVLALVNTLRLLKDTWSDPYDGENWASDILAGVGIVIARNPALDTVRLRRVLASQTPVEWKGEIATLSRGSGGSGGRPMYLAKLLVERYNGKRTTKLISLS